MQEYLINLPTKYKIIIIISIVVLIITIFIFTYRYFYYKDNNYDEVTNELSVLDEENQLENEETGFSIIQKSEKVVVHVIGEVNEPGVVTLEEGARIIDAINKAGGKTEEADLSKINLAYVIEDGVQIYVPRIGENRDDYITDDAGEGIIVESAVLKDEDSKEIKVNINTASLEKLQTLPGVGASTGQKIIDYRNENGKFKNIEDLKNVPGIGEAKYNSLKEYITIK